MSAPNTRPCLAPASDELLRSDSSVLPSTLLFHTWTTNNVIQPWSKQKFGRENSTGLASIPFEGSQPLGDPQVLRPPYSSAPLMGPGSRGGNCCDKLNSNLSWLRTDCGMGVGAPISIRAYFLRPCTYFMLISLGFNLNVSRVRK